MSFIIRNKTAGAIAINDLGLTIPAGVGSPPVFDYNLISEDPRQIATSVDIVTQIQAGNLVALDPLDGATELSAVQSQEIVEVHNDPHYRIRGGELNQLDDVDTTGASPNDVLQLNGSGTYITATPDDIVGNASNTVNQQIVDLLVNGNDSTVTVTGSPPTSVQIDVNDSFLRNTGDTLDSGTLIVASGAVIAIATGGSLTIADAPVNATDAANKAYVDSQSAGLDPKESVRYCAILDVSGTYAAGGGTGGTGAFTAVDFTSTTIFDGLTAGAIAVGDRILVKSQTTATENGIYVVTIAGATGAMERAPDQDGSPASEVSGGNFTFVENGTTCGNTGWVLQGNGILTLNTDPMLWVQFSESSDFIAGDGLALTGSVFSLDINNLTGATITLSDEIAFNDVSGSNVPRNTTVQSFLNDLDIPHGLTGTGIVVQTGNDTFTKVSIAVDGAGNLDGLAIANADGTAGNPTLGLDIQNLPVRSAIDAANDRIAVWDQTANANVYYTVGDVSSAIASTNSFETWAGAGNTSGDASIVADSATDTVTLTGGTGINVDLASATDTVTLDLSFAAIPAGGSPNVVDPTDEIILNNGGSVVRVTMQDVIDGLGLSAFDVCALTAGTPATLDITDSIAVCDSGSTVRFTFSEIFDNLDVVNGITGTGFIVKTGGSPDAYANRSIAVAGVGLGDGLAVTNGDGIAGNPTLELDIDGTPAAGEDLAATDEVIAHNASATANEKFTGQEVADGVATMLGLGGLTIKAIGGSGSPGEQQLFMTDSSRGPKDLSIAEFTVAFSENRIGNNDWLEVGSANDATSGYIMPHNATIVRATAHTASSSSAKDIDLYIDGVATAPLITIPSGGGSESEISDGTLNIDVAAGEKIRLRGGSTGGAIQDTLVTLWVRWRV